MSSHRNGLNRPPSKIHINFEHGSNPVIQHHSLDSSFSTTASESPTITESPTTSKFTDTTIPGVFPPAIETALPAIPITFPPVIPLASEPIARTLVLCFDGTGDQYAQLYTLPVTSNRELFQIRL